MPDEVLPEKPSNVRHAEESEDVMKGGKADDSKSTFKMEEGLDEKHWQQNTTLRDRVDGDCSNGEDIGSPPPEVRVLWTNEQAVSDNEKVYTITIAVRDEDDAENDEDLDDYGDGDCGGSQLPSPNYVEHGSGGSEIPNGVESGGYSSKDITDRCHGLNHWESSSNGEECKEDPHLKNRDGITESRRTRRRASDRIECVTASASDQPIYIHLDASTLREALRGPKAIDYGSLADSPHSTLSTLISTEADPYNNDGAQVMQNDPTRTLAPLPSWWCSLEPAFVCCRSNSRRLSRMKMGWLLISAFVSILLLLLVTDARMSYVSKLKDVANVPNSSRYYHHHHEGGASENSFTNKTLPATHRFHALPSSVHNAAGNSTPVENLPPPPVETEAPPPETFEDPSEAAAKAAEQNLRNQQRIAEIARETAEKAAEENLKAQKRMAERNAAASARHQRKLQQHSGKIL